MNTTTILRSVLVITALVITTFTTATATENNETPVADTVKQNSFVIKYMGESEDNLAFNVFYKKQDNNVYSLSVKDETGETLYQQLFTAKNLSKKIIVTPTEELKKLTVTIADAKGQNAVTKEIIINTRYIQDYIVKIN